MSSARRLSPKRAPGAPQTTANINNPDCSNDWYRPELGEIPYAPLTKANRAKIEARDREIAAKEAELDDIM